MYLSISLAKFCLFFSALRAVPASAVVPETALFRGAPTKPRRRPSAPLCGPPVAVPGNLRHAHLGLANKQVRQFFFLLKKRAKVRTNVWANGEGTQSITEVVAYFFIEKIMLKSSNYSRPKLTSSSAGGGGR